MLQLGRQAVFELQQSPRIVFDNSFISGVEAHTAEIADHSFETSKLVQSFAAGWFNNHAKDSIPSENEIIGFLRLSFNKLREEFRREAESA